MKEKKKFFELHIQIALNNISTRYIRVLILLF